MRSQRSAPMHGAELHKRTCRGYTAPQPHAEREVYFTGAAAKKIAAITQAEVDAASGARGSAQSRDRC